MKEHKVITKFAILSLDRQIRNVGFYVILIVTFFAIQFICYDIGDYLHQTSDKMNIFEIYIWTMSSRGAQVLYLLGLLFLIHGCDFFSNGAAFFLIRMKRKSWISSHIMYLTEVIVLYNIFLIVFFGIACKGAITFNSSWSNAAHMAGQFWVEDIGIRAIMGVNFKMLSFNPNHIGLLTIVLSICIGLFVGMFILIFMLIHKPIWGIAGICLLWFLDMLLVERWDFAVLNKFFPFSMSRVGQIGLWSAGPSLLYTIAYFVVLLVVLAAVLAKIVKKTDFIKME